MSQEAAEQRDDRRLGDQGRSDHTEVIAIELRIDSSGRPVGWLRCGNGPASSFEGWLALMAECAQRSQAASPAEGTAG